MHYYKKNIGDYAKKTGRLSMLQHGAYTLLIDACYDRERFPTLDEAFEWTWSLNVEEREAVEFVLKKFFSLEGDVYVQNRIREEIETYHLKAKENQRIALEREANRRSNRTQLARNVHEISQDVNEPPPNQEPRTKNHKPITNKKKKDEIDFFDVPEKIIHDFQQLRKDKKASITQTAINRIKNQADKAGISLADALTLCCARGWVGFEADWIKNDVGNRNASGCWWASDSSIIAKGLELQMSPNAGERMPDFKARIQAAIENGGKPPPLKRSAVTQLVQPEIRSHKPIHIPDLKSLLRNRDPP